MPEKIHITMSFNEKGSGRDTALAKAAASDTRFILDDFQDIPSDILFHVGNAIFLTELKEPEDYVSSTLSGHLYDQVLTMRELSLPGMVLVLGDDKAISEAIKASVMGHKTANSKQMTIATYENLILDFEANSYALGIPVMRWQASPYRRLLSHAHKLLTSADLTSHRPHPAGNERMVAGASMMTKGLGPKVWKDILQHYEFRLVRKRHDSPAIWDIPGIGAKRSDMITSIFGSGEA
jgi:hypothetical protein